MFLGSTFSLRSVVQAGIDDTGIDEPLENAATNPKNRDVLVSLTISDTTPPSTPILISPVNGAVLTVSIFPFIWKESTDLYGIQYYELFLNGSSVYSSVQPTQTTSEYSTTSSGGSISLTKTQNLPDGNYTWKVRVFDIYDNWTDSATWSFRIDTTPPHLLITKIDELETSISSQDITTIPLEPIETTVSNPLLVGTTEAGSKVKITITKPDNSIQILETDANSADGFQFQLTDLVPDQILTLQFVSQDTADNIAIIDQLKIVYKPKIGVITVPPPLDALVPELPVPEPIQELVEVIQPPIQDMIEQIEQSEPVQAIEPVVEQMIQTIRPLMNIPFLALLPIFLLGQALWFAKIGWRFLSPYAVVRAIEGLGWPIGLLLIPPKRYRYGQVFDLITRKGIASSLVQLWKIDHETQEPVFIDERITDAQGEFRAFEIVVQHHSQEQYLEKYFFTVHRKRYLMLPEVSQELYIQGDEVYLGTHLEPPLLKHTFLLKEIDEAPKSKDTRSALADGDHVWMIPRIPVAPEELKDELLTLADAGKLAAEIEQIRKRSHSRKEPIQFTGKTKIFLTVIAWIITCIFPTPWNLVVAVFYFLTAVYPDHRLMREISKKSA